MDFARSAVVVIAILVISLGLPNTSDAATAASIRTAHAIERTAQGPNALLLLKTNAATDSSPGNPTYGPPYYSGEWQSDQPCDNQHSIYFNDGPPEGTIAEAESDYENQANGCLGAGCTYTLEPEDPTNPDAAYIAAYVELGGSCEGGVDIYQTAHSANVGSGAVNDGGEGDTISEASPYAGDPVNTANGNKYLRKDDYVGTPWLAFRRLYNSDPSTVSTAIGVHWRHSFDRSLQVLGTPVSTIVMTRPDGSQETFQKASGQWTNTTSSVDQLTETDNAQGIVTLYTVFIGAKRHTETYSPAGLLQTVTDETGQGISLTYSTASTPTTVAPTAGLLLTVTDPKNRQLNFVYNSNGLISQVTLPDQGTLAYAYDSNHELTSVTYPDKSELQYFYNEEGLVAGQSEPGELTGIVDESDNRYSSTSYDSSIRATGTNLGGYNYTTTSGGVYDTQVTYNSDGTSTIAYPLGHSTTMGFSQTSSGLSQIASIDQPCAPDCHQRWQTRTYDANGYPSTSTDFKGNVTTSQYDAYGEITSEVDASSTSNQRTINTTWNTTLRLPLTRTVLDEHGNAVTTTEWVYNPLGEPTAKCDIDPAVASSYVCANTGTAPAGVRRWTYTYCTAVGTNCPLIGLLLTVTGPRIDLTQITTYAYYTTSSVASCGTPGAACYQAGDLHTITDAKGHVTTIASYDADGRVTRVTDSNGVNTDSTYTARGWLATSIVGGATTTLTYWPFGEVETIKDPDGVVTTFTYDHAHRLTQITDDLGNYVQYTLDASGNKTGEGTYTSAEVLVRKIARTFNTLGQLTTITDGLNNMVFSAGGTNSYDANGNLVLSSDALGIQRQQGFDPLNRLISTVDNYEGTDTATQNTEKTFAYDSLDRLNGVTDPNALNTIYTFDGLSNRTSLQSPDTGSSSDTYDAAGDRLTHTDAKGIVATSTYDALNRLTSTAYPDTTQNVTYTYDEANSVTGCSSSKPIGRLTRIVEYSVTTIYCYDTKGNVLQKSQVLGTQTDTTVYTYTTANRLKTEKTPDGTLTSYTYNGDGLISSMKLTPAGSTTATTVVSGVTWLPFGPVSSYKLGNSQTITRTYDANYRLTDLTSPALTLHFARDQMGDITAIGNAAGANPATETYGYDPLYRLTGISDSGTPLETYTYNQTGDRLSKTAPGLATGTYSYTPNTHQLVTTGNATRNNDADGNTTGSTVASNAFGFGYSDRNRLVSVLLNGTTVSTYSYNALGQRIEKVTSATERYGYDEGNQLIGEYGTTNRDYIWMGNIPVAVVDVTINGSATTSVVNYIHADHLNTPRAVANSAGTVIWAWAFKGNPFGEQQPTSSSGYTLNLRFPGQYYDVETGLNYNVHRDYDPPSGRYIESDPLGLLAGPNTYAYVGNNPLSNRDPLGLDGPGDMAGAFCPGGLCTLPPDMVQNSWGTPDMGPVYVLGAPSIVVSAAVLLPEISLSGIAQTALLANALNGAIEVPTVIAEGLPQTGILADALEYIGESFETPPPPPTEPVPTQPVAAPLAMPTSNQTTCPQ